MPESNWRIGLPLSLTTCFWWGILPVTMVGVMHKIDPATLTFYRFLIALLILLPFLALRGSLHELRVLRDRKVLYKVLLTGLMLAANYGFYVFALERMTPSGAQVLIQLAPMMFLLSGIFVFDESFSRQQWLGFLVFVAGLATFFHLRLAEIFRGIDSYAIGMLLMIVAALFWVAYAINQKQLSSKLGSVHLMLLINGIGALCFLPIATPSQALTLNGFETLLLLLCGLNTVIAYGAFAEALNHWEASRISATFAIVPLLTLGSVQLTLHFEWIPLLAEPLDAWVLLGAAMVVVGAFVASLSGSSAGPKKQPPLAADPLAE